MKSLISVMVVLIGLLSFSKPMEAQSFQPVLVDCTVNYSGTPAIDYNHYELYARVVTADGYVGDSVMVVDNMPVTSLSLPISFVQNLPVWIPSLYHKDYYRVGVALVGVANLTNEKTVIRKRASEWCDISELSSGLIINM